MHKLSSVCASTACSSKLNQLHPVFTSPHIAAAPAAQRYHKLLFLPLLLAGRAKSLAARAAAAGLSAAGMLRPERPRMKPRVSLYPVCQQSSTHNQKP